MLIQITKDFIVNTEQINYIKGFTDFGDGKEKTMIAFFNKDAVWLSISIEEFIEIIKKRMEG